MEWPKTVAEWYVLLYGRWRQVLRNLSVSELGARAAFADLRNLAGAMSEEQWAACIPLLPRLLPDRLNQTPDS